MAEDVNSALEFAQWIQDRQDPKNVLGIAYKSLWLSVADEDEVWTTPTGLEDPAYNITREALTRSFRRQDAPRLVCWDIAKMLLHLGDLHPLGARSPILRLFLEAADEESEVGGEVAALHHATGRDPGHCPSFPQDEAYQALLAVKHWRDEAPLFYRQVGIPRSIQQAQWHAYCEEPQDSAIRWKVTYEDLLLRIVAHRTQEPILWSCFQDGTSPLPKLAERLDMDEKGVYAAILWTLLDWDAAYFHLHYADLAERLPEDTAPLRQKIERELPVLRLKGAIQPMEDYLRARQIPTLYGRRLLWGATNAQALEHVYMGSVRDLLDVLTVSLFELSEDPPSYVSGPNIGNSERRLSVRGEYVGSNRDEWYTTLKETGTLDNPLTVPLNPIVSLDD